MLDRSIMTTIVNPGLAGGPLHDRRGRVIGVVSLGLAAVGRFSLAIPTKLYLESRERLENGTPPPEAERHAWIGFYPRRWPTASPSRASCPAGRPTGPACSGATSS